MSTSIQNITSSNGKGIGDVYYRDDVVTINLNKNWMGTPPTGCWIGGGDASNTTTFYVAGTLDINFVQGSSFSLGSWNWDSNAGAQLAPSGVINIVGSGVRGYVDPAGIILPNGFCNIAGQTLNNGIINVSDCTIYNYGGGASISGAGTINLKNVTLAGDGFGSADCYWNNAFTNISGQTINVTNSQISFGTRNGVGSVNNVTINCNGGGNYIAFNAGLQGSVNNVLVRGFGNGDILDFGSVGKGDTYTYDPATGLLTISTLDSNNKTISITLDIGLGYDSAGFSIVKTYTGGYGGGKDTGISYAGPAPCFLAGTLIETKRGPIAIEDIIEADQVVAYDQGESVLRRVIWVGRSRVAASERYIKVCRNALGDNKPFSDLHVTEEHCLFFEGCFVPVRMLVNGHSIVYQEAREEYDVYHLELDEHSVITANGVLSESFLDTGHKKFRGRRDRALQWGRDSAAPLCTERHLVESLFRKIAQRVPGLAVPYHDGSGDHAREIALLINGKTRVEPTRRNDQVVVFNIAEPIRTMSILTHARSPSDTVGPFVDDRRLLGALIGEVRLFTPDGMKQFTSHLEVPALTGWHDQESSLYRWTGGVALLPEVQSVSDKSVLALSIHN